MAATHSAQDQLQRLIDEMLEEYKGGLSSTSTKKFEGIKSFFARLLNIPTTEVYAVGSGTRPTNLEVRLTQGLQATKHTTLGLGFLNAEDDIKLEKISDSALVTAEKFLARNKATYDAIGILVYIDNEIRFTRLLETSSSEIGKQLLDFFPDLVIRTIKTLPSKQDNGGAKARSVRHNGNTAPLLEGDLEDLVDAATSAMADANLIYSEELIRRFCASLLTKRFVILTGTTGSGKTRLADAFGRWIAEEPETQCKIIAVGADWTSNQYIFGYPDALNHERYETTTALEFMLEAGRDENTNKPYFLILDEMNLSHVERYFSDFLSAIESGREIDLYRGDDRDPVPTHFTLPENLFVIGTVNIDETTYMFSPKVLDRSNVIEFRVTIDDIGRLLDNPAKCDIESISGAGSAYGEVFANEALTTEITLEEDEASTVKEELLKWFWVMEKAGKQFGFRTVSEVVRFVYFHKLLSDDDWDPLDAIDAQVVQKILPRLHGSRASMEPLLWALLKLAYKDIPFDANALDEEVIGPMLARDPSLDPQNMLDGDNDFEILRADAELELSFDKLWRMCVRVREGFVSSIDA